MFYKCSWDSLYKAKSGKNYLCDSMFRIPPFYLVSIQGVMSLLLMEQKLLEVMQTCNSKGGFWKFGEK